MVANKGEIDLAGIRLLGLSRKDDSKIGQFGTGLKEAITMLLRDGTNIWVFAGMNRVDFQIRQKDGHDEVCFHLTEPVNDWAAGVWHGMGIHPNFGKRDWHCAFQALREIICNAYDEEGMYHTMTDDAIYGEAGHTKIVIESTRDLAEEYVKLEDKLLFLNNVVPFDENKYGKILNKDPRRGKLLWVFHRQVFVQCAEDELPSLFDYDLSLLELNESRSADWYSCKCQIGYAIGASSLNTITEFLRKVSDSSIGAYYEGYIDDVYLRAGANYKFDNWRTAWVNLHGEAAVACSNDDPYFADKLQRMGYKVVCVPRKFLRFFEDIDIPTYVKVLTEDDRNRIEVKNHSLACVDLVWSRLTAVGITTKPCPNNYSFTQDTTAGGEAIFGFVRDNEIYINESIIGSPKERIVVLEECVHALTKASDMTRDLQSWLFKQLDTQLWRK